MNNDHLTEKQFSLLKRAESFTHAGRGLWIFIKSTHNAWVEIFCFVLAVALGLYFGISSTEWIFIIIAAGFVFASEAVNTAIEIDMNLTSPTFHPYARDTKDVAAAAVLIAAVTALAVGLVIFVPKILAHI